MFSQYWRFSILGDLRTEFLISKFLNIHVPFHSLEAGQYAQAADIIGIIVSEAIPKPE